MAREIRLNRVRTVFDDLTYPITADEAREAVADVIVTYADGREPLGDVIERAGTERFDSAEDLEAEVFNHAPIEAVGEPGQSEGDA